MIPAFGHQMQTVIGTYERIIFPLSLTLYDNKRSCVHSWVRIFSYLDVCLQRRDYKLLVLQSSIFIVQMQT